MISYFKIFRFPCTEQYIHSAITSIKATRPIGWRPVKSHNYFFFFEGSTYKYSKLANCKFNIEKKKWYNIALILKT